LPGLEVEDFGQHRPHRGVVRRRLVGPRRLQQVEGFLYGQPPALGVQLQPAREEPLERQRLAVAALDGGHAGQPRVGLVPPPPRRADQRRPALERPPRLQPRRRRLPGPAVGGEDRQRRYQQPAALLPHPRQQIGVLEALAFFRLLVLRLDAAL